MPTADSLDYLARKAAAANAQDTAIKIPRQDFTVDSSNQPPADGGYQQQSTVVPWALENDPVYQAAMNSGSSQFNNAKASAKSDVLSQGIQLDAQRKSLDLNAAEARRQLAGNYAARGMAGGAAGALTLAEAQQNAQQISAQTSIKDQIAALNQNYLQNYGTDTADWTATAAGQNYKTQAAQAAITAQLAKYGVA